MKIMEGCEVQRSITITIDNSSLVIATGILRAQGQVN